jgi:hypothetical protein
VPESTRLSRAASAAAQTGASTLKLKSANGREVGSKRLDLQRLLDHFNIDVDNPINVMTQDASRKFLHSGTNKARRGTRRAARNPSVSGGGNGRTLVARALTPRRRTPRRTGTSSSSRRCCCRRSRTRWGM